MLLSLHSFVFLAMLTVHVSSAWLWCFHTTSFSISCKMNWACLCIRKCAIYFLSSSPSEKEDLIIDGYLWTIRKRLMFPILKSIFDVNNVIILKFTCAFRIPLPVAVDSHQVRCRIALRPHLPVKVSLKLIKLSLSWTKASSRERLVHSDDFCKHCNVYFL